jgi:hypothetical protein
MKFITSTHNRIHSSIVPKLATWQWWLVAIVGFAIMRSTMAWLDGLYAASQFPVPFFIGQTRFDGEVVKGYYAVLMELGTFDKYVGVQIADYAFMVTVFIFQFCLAIAAYRIAPPLSFMKAIGKAMIFIGPMCAVCDALENAVSFVMLANPLEFANWLAIPYSTFAVVKFGIFGLAYLWAIVAFSTGLIYYVVSATCSALSKNKTA